MLFGSDDIITVLIALTWACMSVSSWCNPRFHHAMPTKDDVAALFAEAKFQFVPGLLQVLNAAQPPSIRWFKSLSSHATRHQWGIYVLVVKKRGRRTRIYIGSGTGFAGGVRGRL